ncbi:hypothetical protein Bca4012_091996 [Brassica carinata]
MVKRGGTKRKAEIKKITDKRSKAVTFTKRRDGLFSKAAQLCLLGDAQIAILATPSSSHSNVSFFSFDTLRSIRPAPPPVPEDSREMREDIAVCMARKELGLGYWWEDEKLLASKSREEIMEAMESMQILWKAAERLRDEDVVEFDQRKGSLEKKEDMSNSYVADQTLIATEDDQIIAVCDSFFNYNNNNAALSTTPPDEDEHHHQIEAVSENYCSNKNALLSPAAAAGGGLNDLANVDLDTIFEGLADLDAELVLKAPRGDLLTCMDLAKA